MVGGRWQLQWIFSKSSKIVNCKQAMMTISEEEIKLELASFLSLQTTEKLNLIIRCDGNLSRNSEISFRLSSFLCSWNRLFSPRPLPNRCVWLWSDDKARAKSVTHILTPTSNICRKAMEYYTHNLLANTDVIEWYHSLTWHSIRIFYIFKKMNKKLFNFFLCIRKNSTKAVWNQLNKLKSLD